jgi:hypothetical protein
MATKTLTERFAAPLSGSRVDREAGVIYGALVCGTTSANRRSYPWGKGLTCDPAKYEGRVVNADHGQTATIDRRLGWLANVTVSADGRPRADLHVLKSHPMADRVFEAAERNPSLFGLSHVAVCRTRMESGVEVIESIESVESVDLVADPATTRGLYESKHTMPTTLRKFLEAAGTRKPAAAKWSRAKWVREMDEMPMDLPPVEDASEMGTEDGIQAAFKTAMNSVLDSAMSMGGDVPDADVVKKIKKLLAAKGDINGDGKVDEADVELADDTDDEMPAMESVLSAVETLTGAGLKVTRESLSLVAKMRPADRPAFLSLVTESKGGKARTSGRTDGKTLAEQAGQQSGLSLDSIKLA